MHTRPTFPQTWPTKEHTTMSKAGERILRSIEAAIAYAHGEATEGFIVHHPGDRAMKQQPAPTPDAVTDASPQPK